MGVYVNPPNQTKEDFLKEYGLPVGFNEVREWNNCPDDCLPVALVNNGPFTAAGIAYSPAELRVFTDPRDMRPRQYFYVEKEKLLGVSNLQTYLR